MGGKRLINLWWVKEELQIWIREKKRLGKKNPSIRKKILEPK